MGLAITQGFDLLLNFLGGDGCLLATKMQRVIIAQLDGCENGYFQTKVVGLAQL